MILPVEDIEALLEDAEDVMLYDEAKHEDSNTQISLEEMRKSLDL